LQINQRRILFFRSLLGLCGITFWFLSIRSMPLGMATALFQSSVIFITLLAPIFLGEKVGIYRWTAVVAGLAGVVIITDPVCGRDVMVCALWHWCCACRGWPVLDAAPAWQRRRACIRWRLGIIWPDLVF
jgi:multidrug transporter EmrE-like cation transporter